jgi:hypothetical protein
MGQIWEGAAAIRFKIMGRTGWRVGSGRVQGADRDGSG